MMVYYDEFSDYMTLNEEVDYVQLLINNALRYGTQIMVFSTELYTTDYKESKIYRSAVIL